jgi:hypothetical protein
MGFSVQVDEGSRQSTLIVINPCGTFRRRLVTAMKQSLLTAQDVQTIVLSSISSGWSQYLDLLERRLNCVVCIWTEFARLAETKRLTVIEYQSHDLYCEQRCRGWSAVRF